MLVEYGINREAFFTTKKKKIGVNVHLSYSTYLSPICSGTSEAVRFP